MTTKQIQLSKIATIICDQVFEDPNFLGEVLLRHSFVGEGRGCYSDFELNPDFRESDRIRGEFSDRFFGLPDIYTVEEYQEEVERISAYINPEIDLSICWSWANGDGHLIFKIGDVVLENTDIKKDYTWKFIH